MAQTLDNGEIMTAPRLRGHKAQVAQAEESFASGKMHHAWLLTGPKGIGKGLFAKYLAAAIIAQDQEQGGFFESEAPFSLSLDPQNPVMRQIMQNAHPDYLSIAPIEDEKNKSGAIKVEQIRALTPFFSHKSANGGWRVAIIDNLDAVNVQGANAMLKMVEEPPEKAIILLIARSAGSVLPTIRSRCRELRFEALSDEDQITLLQEHLPDGDRGALEQLAIFSGGSMGYALEIAQTDALDLYEATCLILAKPQSDVSTLLELSGKWGAAKKKVAISIAVAAFSRLLAYAAQYAANHKPQDRLMACELALVTLLVEANGPLPLAELHDDFVQTITRGQNAYLDMPSVFMTLFNKIHSLSHP